VCNLYTYKLSRDEIRGLLQHYKLIGRQWAEVFEKEMAGKNDEALVYPNYLAPVVIEQDGKRVLDHLRWGMPAPLLPPMKPGQPPKPGRPVTNVRNTRSGHWRPWLASSSVVVGKEQNKGGRCGGVLLTFGKSVALGVMRRSVDSDTELKISASRTFAPHRPSASRFPLRPSPTIRGDRSWPST
jgi:hypothetical protein